MSKSIATSKTLQGMFAKLPSRQCQRCFSNSALPKQLRPTLPRLPVQSRQPITQKRTKYKTIEQAKSAYSNGPFSWRSGLLFLGTCGGLVWYFEYEKGRMQRKRIAEAAKGVGRPKVGGSFALTDQNGQPFTSEMMNGKFSLVYFGFTRCPDICPEELDKMARMVDVVEEKSAGVLLPIFITCDPARDDPASLKEYLAEFHTKFIGLTGTYEQIKDLCKKYRVYFSTPQNVKPGQDYLVDHSIYFYLMDPEGDFVEALGRQHSPDQAAHIILGHMNDWKGKTSYRYLSKKMRRFSAVGQCRHAASFWTIRPRQSASIAAASVSRIDRFYGLRTFHASTPLCSKPKGSLRYPIDVDPKSLQEPSEASRKLFSEIAFAFDIDGVLYQGRNRVEGAEKVVKMIRNNGIRYVFLTNGGGVSENSKADTLQQRLQLSKSDDVIRNRMILSHTPMSAWDDSLKNEGTVLITGSHPEQARQLALQYGFKRVVTPGDILAACPDVYPFELVKGGLHDKHVPLPDGKRILKLDDPYSQDIPEDALKIDHIFVWNDPRDWSVDTQIIHDLLISHKGYFATVSQKNGDASLPNNGWQQDGQPGVWISNMDLLWKTNYPVNRFGTGAFMEALKGLWSTSTNGSELKYSAYGKPSHKTYKYAHDRLLNYYGDMARTRGDNGSEAPARHPLRRVYMIGDNPESDIRGANEFDAEDGTEWVSILVRTGVWRATAAQREPRYRPTVIVDDVVDAVVWALNNEGLRASREWVLSALSHTKGYVKLPELAGEGNEGKKGVTYPSELEAASGRV
ncbi:hypothetical protein G7046_g8466 [Stylonectria norvegica]|nr:hypothetical protein G7046_g8466 [Stylonectria norvegica]